MRTDVTRIADLIAARYFDADVGAEVAERLRTAAATGDFDGSVDRHDLAARITAIIAPYDGHLCVGWQEPRPSDPQPESGPERMSERVRAERRNHGFRRVELLPGNLGLIELSEFADLDATSDPDAPARRVADAALTLVQRADAVIFDLRLNGGGGTMADYLVSHFLPEQVLGEQRSRTARREIRTVGRLGGRRRLDVPLYVLTSAQTASAAEFFTATLQVRGRATVVGERTAGAANLGDDFDAGGGLYVFVPMDTPVDRVSGGNWEGVGIEPDLPTGSGQALTVARAAALRQILTAELPPAQARDASWALEALTADHRPDPAAAAEFAGDYGNRTVLVDRGGLSLQRADWPPRRLLPVGPELFAVADDPSRRVGFERRDGRVTAMIETTSTGAETRIRRR